MEIDKQEYEKDLRNELETYDSEGMLLWLNGHLSDPARIVEAHLVKEDSYMRDYVADGYGGIRGIGFDKVTGE